MNTDKNSIESNLKSIKRLLVLLLIVLVVVLASIAGLVWHRHAEVAKRDNQPQQAPGEEVPHNYKHEVIVNITATGILPETLNIPKETHITWLNKDSVSHHLNFSPGTPLPAKFDPTYKIETGNGYGFIMYNPGTYHYYVVEKPTENGTIIVK